MQSLISYNYYNLQRFILAYSVFLPYNCMLFVSNIDNIITSHYLCLRVEPPYSPDVYTSGNIQTPQFLGTSLPDNGLWVVIRSQRQH